MTDEDTTPPPYFGPEAAAELLGFAVVPAQRRGIELLVVADHTLEELDEAMFLEPDSAMPTRSSDCAGG